MVESTRKKAYIEFSPFPNYPSFYSVIQSPDAGSPEHLLGLESSISILHFCLWQ